MTSSSSIASEETALLGGGRAGGRRQEGRDAVGDQAPRVDDPPRRGRGPIPIDEGDDDEDLDRSNDGESLENDEEDREACSREAWLLRFFSLVSISATVASALLLLSQVASVLVLANLGSIQLLLRAYVAIFCAMFLLSELHVEFFQDRAASFKSWFQRGFLYTWVGVMGMEESVAALGQAYPEYPDAASVVISAVLRASSLAVFAVGLLYMLMSICCLRSVWENLQSRQRQQQQPFD
jgi:hypothetical protein